MAVTFRQLLTDIAATFEAVESLTDVQALENLQEHAFNTPLLQVYPQEGDPNAGGPRDRTTYGAGIRRHAMLFHLDLFARQRSFVGLDMAAMVDQLDAVYTKLEEQSRKPYFGNSNIQEFTWRWQRVTIVLGEEMTPYTGVRFFLNMEVY